MAPSAAIQESAASTTGAGTAKASIAPTPTPAESSMAPIVTRVLSLFGVNSETTDGPTAPLDPAGMVWGAFEALRRQFEPGATTESVQTASTFAASQVVANRPPTISFKASENVIASNGTIRGVVHGADPDGNPLTYSAGPTINGGNVVFDSTGHFVYTPGPNFQLSGSTDRFNATVREATATGLTATTTVTIDKSTTAAAKFGWGTPISTNFTGPAALQQWGVYNGPMDGGLWRYTPSAISFANNVMTITGDEQGNSGGLAWGPGGHGQKYGMWEVRVKVPPGAPDYHPVLLVWPDSGNWPTDGEIDFFEIQGDPNRTYTSTALHYSAQNLWETSAVRVDATQWHNYALEWTPTRITAYVDGVPYFTSTNTSHFPPGPMHMTIQLDAAGYNVAGGAKMNVAWARQYTYSA